MHKQGPPGKSAYTARMGEKGQIVIPKPLRDRLGFQPGDTLLLLCDETDGVFIPDRQRCNTFYEAIFGPSASGGE